MRVPTKPRTKCGTNSKKSLAQNPHEQCRHFADGVPGGTRTPDLLLRRQLLYPAELQAHMNVLSAAHIGFCGEKRNCSGLVCGAGEGNRTLVTSLEGWNSTIELHPQMSMPSIGALLSYHIQAVLSRFFSNFYAFSRKNPPTLPISGFFSKTYVSICRKRRLCVPFSNSGLSVTDNIHI